VRNDPEEEREHDTYDEAGNDGKVERGVFAAVNDVAGQFSQAKGELTAKIEESTDKNQKAAKKEEGAAEFAKRVHEVILSEGGNKSAQVCQATVPITITYLLFTILPEAIDAHPNKHARHLWIPHFKVRMPNFPALNSALCLEV
jgi:hypothetical protein